MKKGKLKHSIGYWCFNIAGDLWSLDKLCEVAKELGCESIELVDNAEDLATIQKHGLVCALMGLDNSPNPPFTHGFNNKDNWPKLFERTKKGIDAASKYGCPNHIVFTGFQYRDPLDPNSGIIPLDEGADTCVEGMSEMAVYAAEKGVTLCLEPLNTRDDTHPMKGHPGYQGEHMDYCADIIRRVDSPNLKMLFDFYHTQIMDGDLTRRLHEYKDIIGHIHTAGCPGRGELDENQEISFPPLIRTLVEIGYDGFIGHEFIPTRDPYEGLKQAVELCTVE